MKVLIAVSDLPELAVSRPDQFPKYTTQLMNLANQNAQGTRPSVVGQMTEIFSAFEGKTFDEWKAWYTDAFPDAFVKATESVYAMIFKLTTASEAIDKDLVRRWIEDLILIKTYNGLTKQKLILGKVAQAERTTYRIATTKEEKKGIDGYVGDKAVSIKPASYRLMAALREQITVSIVYYEDTIDGLVIEYDF